VVLKGKGGGGMRGEGGRGEGEKERAGITGLETGGGRKRKTGRDVES